MTTSSANGDSRSFSWLTQLKLRFYVLKDNRLHLFRKSMLSSHLWQSSASLCTTGGLEIQFSDAILAIKCKLLLEQLISLIVSKNVTLWVKWRVIPIFDGSKLLSTNSCDLFTGDLFPTPCNAMIKANIRFLLQFINLSRSHRGWIIVSVLIVRIMQLSLSIVQKC